MSTKKRHRELYHEEIIKSKVVTWFLSNPAVGYQQVPEAAAVGSS